MEISRREGKHIATRDVSYLLEHSPELYFIHLNFNSTKSVLECSEFDFSCETPSIMLQLHTSWSRPVDVRVFEA
jgi:hypothetical protein